MGDSGAGSPVRLGRHPPALTLLLFTSAAAVLPLDPPHPHPSASGLGPALSWGARAPGPPASGMDDHRALPTDRGSP